jgi:hypothetical protein
MAQGDCEMGLPEAWGPEEQKVLVTIYPGTLGEFREIPFRDPGHSVDMEILKPLYDGEMGHGKASFEAPIAAILQFDIDEGLEEGKAGHACAFSLLKELRQLRRRATKAKGFELASGFREGAHSSCPCLSAAASKNRWYSPTDLVATTGSSLERCMPR